MRSKWLTQIEDRGHQKGLATALLRLLRRYASVPADLETAIRACPDEDKLDTWLDLASDRLPLDEFRQRAGI